MTTENNTLDFTEESPQEGLFKFEPIKGYPMLSWKGKRPFTSTSYYPAQLKEQHGEAVNSWLNKIFWGDNLQVMAHLLKEYRGKIKLIYIDPPFDSKADYKKKISLKGHDVENDQSVFEEKQYTDIWSNDEYLQFLYERLIILRDLLCNTGSIFVHVDTKRSHHVQCILDEIFGSNNFQNSICWKRSPFAGSSKARANKFPINHDVILFYTKTAQFSFKHSYSEYSEDYLKRFKNPDNDPKGPYRVTSLKSYSQERFNEWEKEGRLIPPKSIGAGWSYKQYLSDSKGVQADDFWAEEFDFGSMWGDINLDNPMSNVRTNYPTQKPEGLIRRIIQSASESGDIVFDCFMGSGTTQSVAMQEGRRFIGADINLGAIQTTTKRLLKMADELKNTQIEFNDEKTLYTSFEVYNVNHYDIFRNPIQAKELLIQALDIQSIPNSVYDGEKDGRMVKLMPVNHIATKADVADLIHGVDYKAFEKRKEEKPNQPVEKITIYCMGHEPDLAAFVEHSINYKLDIEVVDILRDRSDLQFKRDSEALLKVENSQLVIDKFYPMNLLQKLSQSKDMVSDWREMVESIMIDWNYDGAVFQPTLTDIPAKNELVEGQYTIPEDAGTIRIKITDLLSESLERDLTEEELANG
ncbi:site-specific DNA-methyltransferase [Acinetobacter sp. ESBL14]|uniref:site-specific DNA-methyltransferase n=1 Tax=Acinetobacter sp. ESBL14 TaxID=3077329 RepID=UPI002FCB628E